MGQFPGNRRCAKGRLGWVSFRETFSWEAPDGGDDRGSGAAHAGEEGEGGARRFPAGAGGLYLATAVGLVELLGLPDASFGFVGYGMVVWHLGASICVCAGRMPAFRPVCRIAAGRWGNHHLKVGGAGGMVGGCRFRVDWVTMWGKDGFLPEGGGREGT